MNNLFTTRAEQNFDDGFPLDIVTVQQEQQKQLINKNSKLSTNIQDQISSCYQQVIYNVEIICYDRKMYAPFISSRRMLGWYH